MAIVRKTRKQVTLAPTPEDEQLLAELKARFGVSDADVIRMGIRKLAEAEGLR